MKNVYLLHHIHETEGGEEDVKLIGVYSSAESAEKAKERIRHKPGFAASPDNFHIDCYPLDKDFWTEGFVVDK